MTDIQDIWPFVIVTVAVAIAAAIECSWWTRRTSDEARRIAANIAKLPELVR